MSHPGYFPDFHVNIHGDIFSDEQLSVGGETSLQNRCIDGLSPT